MEVQLETGDFADWVLEIIFDGKIFASSQLRDV